MQISRNTSSKYLIVTVLSVRGSVLFETRIVSHDPMKLIKLAAANSKFFFNKKIETYKMTNEILKTFLRARTNFVLTEVILSLQQGCLTHNISIFESALVWTFLHYSEEDFSYTIAVQPTYWSVNQTQLMGCISLACCHFSLAEPGTVCLSSERVLNNHCSLQCLNRDQHADAFFLVHLPEGKIELGAQLRDRGIHQTCSLVKKGRVLKL